MAPALDWPPPVEGLSQWGSPLLLDWPPPVEGLSPCCCGVSLRSTVEDSLGHVCGPKGGQLKAHVWLKGTNVECKGPMLEQRGVKKGSPEGKQRENRGGKPKGQGEDDGNPSPLMAIPFPLLLKVSC